MTWGSEKVFNRLQARMSVGRQPFQAKELHYELRPNLIDYGLRSFGIGERLLPKTDITFCEQFVLIAAACCGMSTGRLRPRIRICVCHGLALGKASSIPGPKARGAHFLFRGTPLFIQFFFAYELFVQLPRNGFEFAFLGTDITVETRWLTRLGPALWWC